METTININVKILNELDILCEKTKMSRNHIIKHCLKEFEKNSINKIKLYSTVQYQSDDIAVNWSKFHLILTPVEYEFFTDMRNFFKMSLSLLIAFSILQYGYLIIKGAKSGEFTDKYPFPMYYFFNKVISGVKCFIIYWGEVRKEGKMRGK